MHARRAIEWLTIGSAVITLLSLSLARADEGELTSFHGGAYRSHLLFSNSLLFGVGSKTSALGGTCSGFEEGVEGLYWNPARLGLLPGPEMMLDLTPPFLMFDANTFIDLNDQASQAVDDLVDEIGSQDLILASEDYPEIDATVGQKGFLHSGAVALPVRNWGLGLGFYQPLHMELKAIGTGLGATAHDKKDDDQGSLADEVTLSTSADLSLLLDVHVNAFSLGLGKQLFSKWNLGLAVDRYYGHSAANGRLQMEGIIRLAGQERAFNDPSDPWPNQAHSEMVGSYQGTAWGFKMGTSYRLRPNLSLDAMLIVPTTMRLTGKMDIVQHSLPTGIDFEADDPLDYDQIDEHEPTRTELTDNPTADQMAVHIPGALKLGAAWRLKFLTALVQYGHYFGDFSCTYEIDELETQVAYYLGVRPGDAFTLGLDLKVIRLSGGLLSGRFLYRRDPKKEDHPVEERAFLVPTFSLGTGFGVGKRYGVDLLLVSIPTGLMRATTTYRF